MTELNRRTFLAGASAAGMALAAGRRARAADTNSTVVLAIMGTHNRGSQLAQAFAQIDGAEIAYICDCDERAIDKGIDATTSAGGRTPQGIGDFRKALDDPNVDALVCAAPNHWHAAATILACSAGKHVFVEKPASHTCDEGERMIAAARDSGRVVNVGMQRRSSPPYLTLIERIREGAIGRPLFARSWYQRSRPSVGRGKETPPPDWLDYSLWQGPAPERPYRDNVIHYNWHHFWHWGNGEIGNNGVHTIDVCRWALGVDYPSRITAAGSRLRYDDDQETPDTMSATFDFDDRMIVWDGISWTPPDPGMAGIGIEIRGTGGTIMAGDHGFTIHDMNRRVVEEITERRDDAVHFREFLDAVRSGSPPPADIEEGHKSTLLCHLANIAYRIGQPLETDPSNGHIKDNAAAEALWARDYRPGWMPSA